MKQQAVDTAGVVQYDLEQRKIELKVLTQNIDTGTLERRLFFHVTAAFDEFQRKLIVENTRAGLATAHKGGRRGGRLPSMNMDRIHTADFMLIYSENNPFISDNIKQLELERTTFYRHFLPERIGGLRQLK